MPVIVIGADTTLGVPVVEALTGRDGEVRAFVTDPAVAARLRSAGVNVALGDISDTSHVGSAAIGAFTAVVFTAGAADTRDRSFIAAPGDLVAGWATALADAGIRRVIVVTDAGEDVDPGPLLGAAPETAVVPVTGRSAEAVAADVLEYDEAHEIRRPPTGA